MRTNLQAALAAVLIAAAAVDAAAQSGRVTGVVRDERGEPIRGATIIAENADASPNSFTVTSDNSGRFAIIGLRTGLWSFRAGAPGYTADGGDLNVRTMPNVTPPITFRLQRLVTPPSALGSVAPKDLQTALARADELFQGERWDEAVRAYREILERAPSLTVIHLQIASAHRHRKAFDEAIAAYDALLKVDPGNNRARLGIAMTNFQRGDLAAAEQTLEAAAQAPDAPREVFFDLGQVRLARSQPDAAVEAYERAASLDPTWGKPAFALGRLALDKGDTVAARQYFATVVEVDPVSPEAAQAATLLEQLEQVQ